MSSDAPDTTADRIEQAIAKAADVRAHLTRLGLGSLARQLAEAETILFNVRADLLAGDEKEGG